MTRAHQADPAGPGPPRLDRRVSSVVAYRSEGEECVARPNGPSMVLMKRQAPEQSPPLDEPNVSHLHRACLLWTYYLRAESEAKKQAYLYEAARHLMLHQPCGNEGEEVYVQVWEAIQRRELARAYIKTDIGYNYAEATDEGGFATFRIITY